MPRDSIPTRATLLELVRDVGDEAAWRRFEGTYRELLVRFCRGQGLQWADAEDAVQAIFAKLVRGLRAFRYDPARGRFRDYLYRCARSAIADLRRCPNRGAVVVDPSMEPVLPEDPELAALFEREWTAHHYRLAVASLVEGTEPRSLAAFEAFLAGRTVREVARDFTLSEAAVYKLRERLRERLRDRILEQVREEDRGGG